MGWHHIDPMGAELVGHEGWPLAANDAGDELPPIQQAFTRPDGTTGHSPNSNWELHNGRDGRPLAAGLLAGCECGWRGAEVYPIDWDDREGSEGFEYNDGPYASWAAHANQAAGATVPGELAEAISVVERMITGLTSTRPLAALAAVHRLEQHADELAAPAAVAARRQGATWEQLGTAAGSTRQAAFQRFRRHTP